MRRWAMRPSAERPGTSGAARGPPRHDRGVWQQQAHDEALLIEGGIPARTQHDDLARAGVAADADLGIEPGLDRRGLGAGLGRDDDDAHRMLAGCVVGGLDGLLLGTGRCRDDKREHAPECDHAALLAELDEASRYLARRGVGQFDDHGRLQFRPSRSRSSSADVGPQVPGRYCSG